MTSFQVKVLQKKFTLLHAHFSKIVLKYSNEVHLLRYLTPLTIYCVLQTSHKISHCISTLSCRTFYKIQWKLECHASMTLGFSFSTNSMLNDSYATTCRRHELMHMFNGCLS